MLENIDFAIIILFLGTTLFAGFSHQSKQLEDFAIGGRDFSIFAMVCTMVATWMSGSSFSMILSKIYANGLYYYIANAGATFSFLIAAIFFIPRMGAILGNKSIAEYIGTLYGNETRAIAAFTGIIGAIGYVAAQFKIFGNLFEFFWDMDPKWSIICAGLIVTLYSATGGIKSVTYTDIVQFVAFTLAIPFIGIFIWNDWYNKVDVIHLSLLVQDQKFDYAQVFDPTNPELLATIPLLIYFSIPNMGPTMSQRILIGSSLDRIRKSFLIGAVVLITLETIISIIPFLLASVDPTLAPDQLLGYVITNYSYPGIKGLVIVGVISMAMSTADSWINSSSVFFANDLFPIFKLSSKFKLNLAKIFSVTIGSFAIILAYKKSDLLDIILSSTSLYYGMVTPVLILTIFNFRTTKKIILTSSLVSFLFLVFIAVKNSFAVEPKYILFCMVINAAVIFFLHYGFRIKGPNLGWIESDSTEYIRQLRKKRMLKIKRFFVVLKNFNIIKFFEFSSPKDARSYVVLGCYCMFSTITTMYAQIDVFNNNSEVMTIIYEIIMVTSLVTCSYPIFPSTSEKFKHILFGALWFISIFGILIFLSINFALLTRFSNLQLSIFTANTFVAFLLLGWRTAITFLTLSFVFAINSYKHIFLVPEEATQIGSPLFVFVYLLTLIASIVLFFLKPKEEKSKITESILKQTQRKLRSLTDQFEDISSKLDFAQNKANFLDKQINFKNIELKKLLNIKNEFIYNLQHETHTPITGIVSMAEVLYDVYHQLNEEEKQRYITDIADNAKRLLSFVDNMIDLSKLSSMRYSLVIEKVHLSDLIYKHVEICKRILFDESKKYSQEFIFDLDETVLVECDKYYIGQVLDNIITNAVNYSESGFILVRCKKIDDFFVEVSFKDEGIGIPKNELFDVFGSFVVGSNTKTKSGGRGVGLALCKKVIDVHKGEIWIKQNTNSEGITCFFTLPIKSQYNEQDINSVKGQKFTNFQKEQEAMVLNMYKHNIEVDTISKITNFSKEKILDLLKNEKIRNT